MLSTSWIRLYKILALQCTLYLLCIIPARTQTVFILESIPSDTPMDASIYISGNFEGWSGGAEPYRLSQNDDEDYYYLFDRTSGTIQFKFTRGSWATVEKGPNGEEIANRQYTFTPQQDTVWFTIASWAGGTTGSTAADNVIILDEAFPMSPFFNRNRTIRLYLPPGYEENTDQYYPVLYMHDGQNLFDQFTSFAGEWEVDETLNRMYEEEGFEIIVVGIDNGLANRIAEYTPWAHVQHGGGDGELYTAFIVEALKPYIDEHYRTKPEREYSGIMGSSLGGLISHYAVMTRQEVFSKAGVFSPAFWFSDSIFVLAENYDPLLDTKFYLMAGSSEGQSMVPLMEQMASVMVDHGLEPQNIVTKTVQGGQHNEFLWRTEFEEAIRWLFKDLSTHLPEKKSKITSGLKVYPNPSSNLIILEWEDHDSVVDIRLTKSDGTLIWQQPGRSGLKWNTNSLSPGLYLITVTSRERIHTVRWLKK